MRFGRLPAVSLFVLVIVSGQPIAVRALDPGWLSQEFVEVARNTFNADTGTFKTTDPKPKGSSVEYQDGVQVLFGIGEGTRRPPSGLLIDLKSGCPGTVGIADTIPSEIPIIVLVNATTQGDGSCSFENKVTVLQRLRNNTVGLVLAADAVPPSDSLNTTDLTAKVKNQLPWVDATMLVNANVARSLANAYSSAQFVSWDSTWVSNWPSNKAFLAVQLSMALGSDASEPGFKWWGILAFCVAGVLALSATTGAFIWGRKRRRQKNRE
ncbi:hypothetical protein HK104_007200, partial [Borealophlyctis nickersoniae]